MNNFFRSLAPVLLGTSLCLSVKASAETCVKALISRSVVEQADPQGPPQRRLKSFTHGSQKNDFGDPSPPDFSVQGIVKVYTTGGHVLSWFDTKTESATNRFLRGVTPHDEMLILKSENGEEGYDPWDPTIETFPEFGSEKYLYAGVMTPPPGKERAQWPNDNWRRRVNAFRSVKGAKGQDEWIRVPKSILGDAPDQPGWLDHSYGHQFLRDEEGKPWMFYEKVAEERDGQPFKTEIFARRLLSPIELSTEEISILKVPQKMWPRSKHANGSLVEGPRPVRLKNGFLIGFSAGDYNSDGYGIHFMWSKKLTGPYRPFLTTKGQDLRDFALPLRQEVPFTWGAGRPALFEVDGKWWILFHGIDKRDHARVDHGQRSIYLAPLKITEKKSGPPSVEILINEQN